MNSIWIQLEFNMNLTWNQHEMDMSAWNYGVIPNSRFFQKQCKDFLVRNELFSLVSYVFPSFSFEVLKKSITLHRSFTKVRIRVGLRQENLHIEKALLTLCFLIVLNFHNQNAEQKQKQGWLPRGVKKYTLRSVLRGLRILNAHFTDVYILQRGCFSVCFSAKAVEGQERWTGRCKHPLFLYVVVNRDQTYLTLGVCQNKKEKTRQ